MTKVTALVTVNCLLEKSRGARSGTGARCSTSTKAPTASAPTARATIGPARCHAVAGPSVRPQVVALGATTWGLTEGPATAWQRAGPIVALAVGALAVGAFVLVEHRAPVPLLAPRLFSSRQFTVTNAVTFVIYGALGGVLFLLPIVLQVVDHYTPLASGVALLPLTGIMLMLSSTSGRMATRFGPRLQMTVGPVS